MCVCGGGTTFFIRSKCQSQDLQSSVVTCFLGRPREFFKLHQKKKYKNVFQSTLNEFRHVPFLDGSRASPPMPLAKEKAPRGRRRCWGVKGILPGSQPLSQRGTNAAQEFHSRGSSPSTTPKLVATPLWANMQVTVTAVFIQQAH